MLALSVLLAPVAPRLDRLDQRRALPIGYVSTARRPSAGHGAEG
jgi:hypothetical protein